MKYIRKVIALLIVLVFFAALVIGLGMIFAIKNVNVTLLTYTDGYQKGYEETKTSLSYLKGDSLVFMNEDGIYKALEKSNYSVENIEKVYPCTVNITLRERVETFAVNVGELFYMYDSCGRYIDGRKDKENINITDGLPDVELKGVPVDNIEFIAKIAQTFKNTFKSLRSSVTDITLEANPDVEGFVEKLVFNLRCGLKIQLDDYTNDYETKISVAYAKFCTLSDRQKLGGTLRSYRLGGEDGIINADYLQKSGQGKD